ncbi:MULTISPECIES: GGDEF domain-containing protein [Deefgea]|uniref:diguanylate cyclase n=1 Tax=Deefgea chitinilytica TaxID=570276 RepID=A0ABS2C7F2_9NEIS|nr:MULTISPECIES: GGDEF domain-containing protein [Deefgea]MBM5570080.1 diguanylate cyclase [Deefgea chitinilytica]MBM9887309.1 GGDEF domain-containing protein [Deefgea sp. CFH1-16]
MTMSTPVNPVEIARIALKRLTERGLPPTPDNYTQFYNAILTIKAPETKTATEMQLAWQVLYKLDDAVSDTAELTSSLLDNLASSSSVFEQKLGDLQQVRQAHAEKSVSPEETHASLEDMLNVVISTTHNVHSTVTTSHSDLQTIRDSIRHIEEDLAFNRKVLEQDALTGALNRQGLDHLLMREVKRAQRIDGRLTAAIIDLDDFKQINDKFTHLVGDQVLIHMTNLTKAVLRESDILVRYGGEEFLLLLVDTDVRGASYVIDRLKLVAGRTPFIHHNQRIEVRFSAGIAQLKDDENGRALLLRADEALYRAKQGGRGKTEIAE